MKSIRFLIFFVVVFGLFGCSNDQPSDSKIAGPDNVGADMLDKAMLAEGDFGNGSMYELHCPEDWNGGLVVYCHGYAFPETEPALPSIDELRGALLAEGYGVAYSSYSETGWAVHVAINNSRQLRGLFASQFGMPEKTYVMGNSMGGLITLALTEKHPLLYDGAVPMCGVLGGTDMAVDYIFNLRLLFDYYYPGVLPGSANSIPEGFDWTQAQYLAYLALASNPLPAFEMAGIDPLNITYSTPEELIESILWGLIFHTASINDFLDRNHGHEFFDNMDVVYSGSSDDVALNEGVGRFTSTADAEAFARRWYEPSGKLKVPVVSIHTTRDPVVQVFQEYEYAEVVAEAGNSELLRQYEIDRFGHCTFTTAEIMAAFHEMVSWSNSLAVKGALRGKY